MLKAKKSMVNGEMVIKCVENCNWNHLATTEETMDFICEGFNIPVDIVVETLNNYLMADAEGEIVEFKRTAQVAKLETLYSFGLNDNSYGVLTGSQIDEMCIEANTTIYKKTIASYDDAEWMVCCGGTIEEGVYLVENGLLECDEDGELEFIDLRIAV
ncbi:hypothetical protein [Clostridium tagluense]|uniref:hypothetical protein n=1 Tax=Clostridium tagluense TaxID=360422 RepID=UPI001CF5B45D|nr:hypothetical protein [Clostridium tagluense]MCB2297070.1 hypothetical protein [Clostridium tagluense]